MGLPAVTEDGRSLALATVEPDPNRGAPNLTFEVRVVEGNRVTTKIVVLSTKSADAPESARARIAIESRRHAEASNTILRSRRWVSLPPLEPEGAVRAELTPASHLTLAARGRVLLDENLGREIHRETHAPPPETQSTSPCVYEPFVDFAGFAEPQGVLVVRFAYNVTSGGCMWCFAPNPVTRAYRVNPS